MEVAEGFISLLSRMKERETYLAVNGMVTKVRSWCFLTFNLGNFESGEVVVVMGEEVRLYGVELFGRKIADCDLILGLFHFPFRLWIQDPC